jgi:hypothetical protein
MMISGLVVDHGASITSGKGAFGQAVEESTALAC